MKLTDLVGYYVTYKDSGRPVEVFDQVTYAFIPPTRECLVKNTKHLALLLETRRYYVSGVEVEDAKEQDKEQPKAETPEVVKEEPKETKPYPVKKRGRKPKGV